MRANATPAVSKSHDPEDADTLFPGIELPGKEWMPRKKGKAIHRSTAVRWMLYHEPRLKSIMIGGSRCTCRRWVEEFFEACTGADNPNPISEQRRKRDHADAERELDLAGLG